MSRKAATKTNASTAMRDSSSAFWAFVNASLASFEDAPL